MLIDSVLAFRYIPQKYAQDLVNKLVKLGAELFKTGHGTYIKWRVASL